jgi:hypothetical protein
VYGLAGSPTISRAPRAPHPGSLQRKREPSNIDVCHLCESMKATIQLGSKSARWLQRLHFATSDRPRRAKLGMS